MNYRFKRPLVLVACGTTYIFLALFSLTSEDKAGQENNYDEYF